MGADGWLSIELPVDGTHLVRQARYAVARTSQVQQETSLPVAAAPPLQYPASTRTKWVAQKFECGPP